MRIAAGALALIGLCSATVPAAAEKLQGSTIQSRLVGRSIAWWDKGSQLAGALFLAPDGRAEIVLDTAVQVIDKGTWRIDGAQLCTRWTLSRSGQEKCYWLEEVAPDRFDTTGGTMMEIRDPMV
jgi:hypothetical protein